jgi:hypothetical protein
MIRLPAQIFVATSPRAICAAAESKSSAMVNGLRAAVIRWCGLEHVSLR